MQTDTRLGTVEDVLGKLPAEVAAIANELRDLIVAIHPEAVEVPRPGEPSIAYGLGPKKMSEAYAYLMPQRASVNLGFFRGAALADPAGLLEGTGKALRHVKVGSLEAARRPALRDLIAAALAERRAALGR